MSTFGSVTVLPYRIASTERPLFEPEAGITEVYCDPVGSENLERTEVPAATDLTTSVSAGSSFHLAAALNERLERLVISASGAGRSRLQFHP